MCQTSTQILGPLSNHRSLGLDKIPRPGHINTQKQSNQSNNMLRFFFVQEFLTLIFFPIIKIDTSNLGYNGIPKQDFQNKISCRPPFQGSLFGKLIFVRCHDFGWPCAASRGAIGESGSGFEKLSKYDTCKVIFRMSVSVIGDILQAVRGRCVLCLLRKKKTSRYKIFFESKELKR